MYGIYGIYGAGSPPEREAVLTEGEELRSLNTASLRVSQHTLRKFMQDKLWCDKGEYLYALEGVVFNMTELVQKYGEPLLPNMFLQKGETFVQELRGSFSLLFYVQSSNTCFLYTDHIGGKLVFYCEQGNSLFFAPSMSAMRQAMDNAELDEQYAYSMLTYGYSPTENTPIKGVFRLLGGEYLRMDEHGILRKQYHRFDNTPIEGKSVGQHIQEVDRLFRQAVRRMLDKNAQYNLDNLMPLSAGLDSRMVVWVANSLGAKVRNFTFSQTNYYDHIVPGQISRYLGNDWVFEPLDGGDYLKNIDESIAKTEFLSQYSGPAQVWTHFQPIIQSQDGVIATGMVGDIVLSSHLKTNERYYIGEGAFSDKLLGRLKSLLPSNFTSRYANEEIYYLYVRGFLFANMGSPVVFQHYTETSSPFADVDFLQYCFHIPFALRKNYYLYDRWILQCYPQAAQWAHNGAAKIGHRPCNISLFHRTIPLSEWPKRAFWHIMKKMRIHDFYQTKEGDSMNPIDSWLQTNVSLRKSLDEYIAANLLLIKDKAQLQADCNFLIHNGVGLEKLAVITLLSTIKQLHLSI